MEDTNVTPFPGFWHPKAQQGFTQLPHELFDLMHEMSEPELRVVLYIFRHTWGFQEFGKAKKLTTEEFMNGRKYEDKETGEIKRMDKGTGLSDRGVKNGIAEALEHGYIFCSINDKDKARVKKSYGIKIYKLEEYA